MPRGLKAKHCKYFKHSRCYQSVRLLEVSRREGRPLKSTFCYQNESADHCGWFEKKPDQPKLPANIRQEDLPGFLPVARRVIS